MEEEKIGLRIVDGSKRMIFMQFPDINNKALIKQFLRPTFMQLHGVDIGSFQAVFKQAAFKEFSENTKNFL